MKIKVDRKSIDVDAMCCHGVLVERDFPAAMVLLCWQSGQLMVVAWQQEVNILDLLLCDSRNTLDFTSLAEVICSCGLLYTLY